MWNSNRVGRRILRRNCNGTKTDNYISEIAMEQNRALHKWYCNITKTDNYVSEIAI